MTAIKTTTTSPQKWEAYRDLFAAVQTAKRWSRAQLVDELNKDAKAKVLPKCTYSKRTTEYWEANPTTAGRSSAPRAYRLAHLHQWLSEQITDVKFAARLAAIAPPAVESTPVEGENSTDTEAQKDKANAWYRRMAEVEMRKVVKNVFQLKKDWQRGRRDTLAHFLHGHSSAPREQTCANNGFTPHQNLSMILREFTAMAMDIEDGRADVERLKFLFASDLGWWADFMRDFVRCYVASPSDQKPQPDPPWVSCIPKLFERLTVARADHASPISGTATPRPSLVSTLLPARNTDFFGFASRLEEIRQRFGGNGNVELGHAAAIKGDGGVGKTQLASEFAHRCLADGSGQTVLWCRAESEGNFDEDLAAPAPMLGAPAELKDKAQRMRFTVDWLRDKSGWLLVADNADEVAARNHVCTRLGARAHGWLLVTTRLRDPGSEFSKVEVEKVTPQEGAEFLMHCVPGKGTQGEALSLATELDCLFLALAWAVAELRESGDTFAQLLKRYRSAPLDVIRRLPQGWRDRKPVLKCWLTSYARLSPLACRLLHVMGWFAAERIGEKWLTTSEWFAETAAAAGLKPKPNDDALKEAVRELHARRFCTRDEEFVSMHRLVQLSARTELLASLPKQSKLNAKVFLASAVDLLLRNSPPTGENSWDFMAWIEAYPHAEILFAHIQTERMRSAQAARLCFALAQSQRRLKRLRDSLGAYAKAVEMAGEFLASAADAHEIARWHNAAACACCQLSAFPAARDYMTDVRAFTDRALGCTNDKIQRLVMERRFVCHNACTALHWSYELTKPQEKSQRENLQRAGLDGREKQLTLSKRLRELKSKGEATSYLQALAEAGHAFQKAGDVTRAKALSKEGFAEFRRLRDSVELWQHLESGISGFVNSTKHLAGLLFSVRMLIEAREAVGFVLEKVPALGGCRNADAHTAQLLLLQINHAEKPNKANVHAAKECVEALRTRLEPNDRSLKQAEGSFVQMQATTAKRKRSAKTSR